MTWDQFKYGAEILANIATVLGVVGVVFLFAQHYYNKDIRNLQLMQRCIDNFRTWYSNPNKQVDFYYLELLNEELFYFQKKLIDKEVAIEWIEGILDYIIVYSPGGPLNNYKNQVDITTLDRDGDNKSFFFRIYYFVNTTLSEDYNIPFCNENEKLHHLKKRQLAIELYKHIRKYKY